MKRSLFRTRRLAILAIGLAALITAYTVTRNSANELYITAAVERGTVARYVKGTGTVETVITVDVSSQLSARMAEVLVAHNAMIKPALYSVELHPDDYDAGD